MTRTATDYTVLAAAIIGILLAAYAVGLHYAPSSSSFCDINASWNCDKVNKSPWAVFMGVPVAILGLLAYLALFVIVLKRGAIQQVLSFTTNDYYKYLFIYAIVMFGFQAYLTYIEAFVIGAYCIVCLGSQTCTIVVATAVGARALQNN